MHDRQQINDERFERRALILQGLKVLLSDVRHLWLSLVFFDEPKVEAPAGASIRMRAPAGQPFCEAA
ncbi:MAG: hypothetical protein V7672_06400 [Brevundimonas sp.]|jgi:hypothetical protein|uniref:hypothetical protein n=1 Tax=Brevundimonas sp. TaxID=1871086 RepID=UPI003001013B